MSDLTAAEQTNVRRALRFLRAKLGTWHSVGLALPYQPGPLGRAAGGRETVTLRLTVRAARLAGVPISDVLDGRYPPAGVCPHCGGDIDPTVS